MLRLGMIWRRLSILFAVAGAIGAMVSCTPQPAESPPAIFRIRPVRPVEELRREALLAQPPVETGKLPSDLVDVLTLDSTIRLDIRYATTDNFLSTKVDEVARAMLQRPAAEALVRAHRALAERGYGILTAGGRSPDWRQARCVESTRRVRCDRNGR
jgi:D-alanyl-D-alanine dipeptidase